MIKKLSDRVVKWCQADGNDVRVTLRVGLIIILCLAIFIGLVYGWIALWHMPHMTTILGCGIIIILGTCFLAGTIWAMLPGKK